VYLLNYLSLQLAQQLFIAAGRFRTGQNLVGAKDGVNLLFRVPGSDHYTHNLPFFTIAVYLNGQRMTLLDDYIVVETLGSGTGYDGIIMNEAPFSDDHLTADYITQ